MRWGPAAARSRAAGQITGQSREAGDVGGNRNGRDGPKRGRSGRHGSRILSRDLGGAADAMAAMCREACFGTLRSGFAGQKFGKERVDQRACAGGRRRPRRGSELIETGSWGLVAGPASSKRVERVKVRIAQSFPNKVAGQAFVGGANTGGGRFLPRVIRSQDTMTGSKSDLSPQNDRGSNSAIEWLTATWRGAGPAIWDSAESNLRRPTPGRRRELNDGSMQKDPLLAKRVFP